VDARLPVLSLLTLIWNIISFVDRDMVMRYFGGGIGHLKNTPPQQVPGFDPIDPSSEEMAVNDDDDDDLCTGSGTNEDLGTVVQQLVPSRDVVMNGGELVQLEVGEDDDKDDEEDEEDSDDDEGGDQSDEDEGEEGEDDYGYASA
jgi:hypothetical protein